MLYFLSWIEFGSARNSETRHDRIEAKAPSINLLFPECMPYLVGERLEQIGKNRPVAGDDERLHGHPRHGDVAAEFLFFAIAQSQPRRVAGQARRPVDLEIRGDGKHSRLQFRRGLQIEVREPDDDRLVARQAVDVHRLDPRLDNKQVFPGDGEHGGFSRADDAAHRVYRQLVDIAGPGRADIDPAQFVSARRAAWA